MLRQFIRSKPGLYSAGLRFKEALPAFLRYDRLYFEVKRLLKLQETGSNALYLKKYLKKRLALLLREALSYVPYYRENVRVSVKEINEESAYDILKVFPYLSKETIMRNQDAFINQKYNKRGLYYKTGGGSTGQGIGVWKSLRDLDVVRAFNNYEFEKVGFQLKKSKIVRCGNDAMKKKNEPPWEERGTVLMLSPPHFTPQWIEAIYEKLVRFEPEFFVIYPSCLEEVAKFIRDKRKPVFKCKHIFLAAEGVTDRQYRFIKEFFSATIGAIYNLTEGTHMAVAQGPDITLYRLNQLFGYSENLPDEYGNFEIVGTSYWQTAMPLIRYRTQDLGKIFNGVIHSLDGRKQEYLIAKDGSAVIGYSIRIDDFTWDYVNIYQVVQEEKGKIRIKVVPRGNFNDSIKNELLKRQRERWGGLFDISIEVVDDIARTKAGKRRLIVNASGCQPS